MKLILKVFAISGFVGVVLVGAIQAIRYAFMVESISNDLDLRKSTHMAVKDPETGEIKLKSKNR